MYYSNSPNSSHFLPLRFILDPLQFHLAFPIGCPWCKGKSGSLPDLQAIPTMCFNIVFISIFSQKRKIEYDFMIQMYQRKKSRSPPSFPIELEIKNLLTSKYLYKYYLYKYYLHK
jgi:hypothetical protein